jgi:peptidoglycan hydrolase-like protein with peptidoglycan-binding domain
VAGITGIRVGVRHKATLQILLCLRRSIYGYRGLTPDRVIASVQAALQQECYYHGDIDGMLGPVTRSALANYQHNRGLYVTSAVDRPTLE